MPSPSDTSFVALRDGCLIVDKTRHAYCLGSKPHIVEVILRPTGYGKSTFLSMLADLQDLRPDNERTIPPTIRTLFAKESIFRPSSSMVLLLDLATLDVGRLAESLQDLMRTSVIAFARKYDTELREDMDLLCNVAPTRALSLVAVSPSWCTRFGQETHSHGLS